MKLMRNIQISGFNSTGRLKTGSTKIFSSRLLILMMIMGVILFVTLPACKNDTKVIENDHLRMVFITKPVPFLKELIQKPSQKNLLTEPADQNLFTYEISQAEGKKLIVESQSAKKGSIKVSRDKKNQQIMIKFTGLGPANDMQVNINGVLDNDEPIVRWSIKIDNPWQAKNCHSPFSIYCCCSCHRLTGR
jgi:hypothetical protein